MTCPIIMQFKEYFISSWPICIFCASCKGRLIADLGPDQNRGIYLHYDHNPLLPPSNRGNWFICSREPKREFFNLKEAF